MEEAYGNADSLSILLVHSGNHFFLACPLFGSEKAKVTIPTNRKPEIVRPGSYETLNFGPPPDDFYEEACDAPPDEFFDPNF